MILRSVKWSRVATAFVFVAAVTAGQFSGASTAFAAGSTLTWDGSTGDNNFSTAANWSTNAIPTDGDLLIFNKSTTTTNESIDNDLDNLSLAGITYTGEGATGNYSISGNEFTLTGNIVNTATSSGSPTYLAITADIVLGANVSFQRVRASSDNFLSTQGFSLAVTGECTTLPALAGSGNLTTSAAITAIGAGSTGYTGNIVVTAGTLFAPLGSLGTAAGTTTTQGTGSLSLYALDDSTWSEPFILGGTGTLGLQHSSAYGCNGAGGTIEVLDGTFTGPVTLNSNFKFKSDDNITIAGTYNANGHTFVAESGTPGKLITPQETIEAPVEENTYSDSQPDEDVVAYANQTAIIDGTRGYAGAMIGGTIMGTGTVKGLFIIGGTLSPGHSPGTITALESFEIEQGTYKAELKNTSEFDQVKVSDPSRTTGNDVLIFEGAKLDVVLYDGYSIKKGDSFKIIDNLQPASQAVEGTFEGYAEGAQVTIGGIVFSISYVGGDGNDVVLTALNTGADPSAPNTAANLLKTANPIAVLGLGIAAAAMLLFAAKRRSLRK